MKIRRNKSENSAGKLCALHPRLNFLFAHSLSLSFLFPLLAAAAAAARHLQRHALQKKRGPKKELTHSHFPIFIHLGIPAFPFLPLPSLLDATAAFAPPPPPPALCFPFASSSSSAFAFASAFLAASAAPETTPLRRSASSSGRSLGASFGVVVFAAAPLPLPLPLETLAGPQCTLAAGLSPSENSVSLASSAGRSTVFGGAV